jgi:sigma-B regulation protein RsbU (phosphoserine phosphatase)
MAESTTSAKASTSPAGPPNRRVKVLLIDDQAIVGQAVKQLLAAELDIDLHFCQDPTRALKTAEELRPTVILQDLVMPDIDGLMLVKFFRANPATKDTPMIVLSSKEEPLIKAQAFGLGANDYLVKLPDKIELIARIRYHSNSYLTLLERNEAFRQLEESRQLLADELAQAARYVQSLLPQKLKGDVQADWRFVPSSQLGGDMFGYHWLDPDHLAVFLLDVSGHGVGSSLLAVSASNLLAARSLPNTDFSNPGAVLRGLNDAFQMEKQNGKYFTMFYAVFNRPARTLTFSNAGHPPGLLFTGPSPNEATLQRLESQGLMIGAVADFDYESATVPLDRYARLLVYSDGVFEISKPDGKMWEFEEFVQCVTATPADDALDGLLKQARTLHGNETLDDDFSLLELAL